MSTRPVAGSFEAYRAQKGQPRRARSRTRPASRPGPGVAGGVPRATPRGTARPTSRPAARPTARNAAVSTWRAAIRPSTRVAAEGPLRIRLNGRPRPLAAHPRRLGPRLIALPVLSVVLFGVVALKLVDVQVRNPQRWQAQGELQRGASVPVLAGRGSILDRHGEQLSISVPRRTVFADPTLIPDRGRVARALAPVLGMARAELTDLLSPDPDHRSDRYRVLARTVADSVADRVEGLGLAGVGTVEEFKRVRPTDALARSLLGSVDVDGSGISGLEYQLDDELTGTPGEVVYERAKVDGGGAIAGTRRRVAPARPGSEVTLTVDRALQYEVEKTLEDQLIRAGATGGIAIVTRPSTGEVLALANLETDEEGGYVPSSNNLALTTVYEPGSVNKVITVAAAIEEGLVEPDTQLDVPDSRVVGDHTFTDSHPHPTTRWTVTDILATSSNVGTIMLADMLGPERMDRYLRRFGFGTRTGLGFPKESAGILLPADQWRVQSTSMGSIPIGQGVSVTAMQMIDAINVLANDGTYVPPRLLRSITRPDGTKESIPSGQRRRVVSPETAAAVRAMMAQVVARGTGQEAQVAGYEVAGKTGTARKPQSNGTYRDEYGRMHYMATFVGLLPAERPDLSVIVVVDEPDPSRSIYASEVAAPAFAELARLSLSRLSIPPSVGGSVSDVPEMSESARDIDDVLTPGEVRPPDEQDDEPGNEDAGGSGTGPVGVDRSRRDRDTGG